MTKADNSTTKKKKTWYFVSYFISLISIVVDLVSVGSLCHAVWLEDVMIEDQKTPTYGIIRFVGRGLCLKMC